MTIKINGTNTTAQPSITGTDTDTGLVYGTGEVSVVTDGTERLKVDSSGRVGIGTSSPTDYGGYGGTLEISGSPGGALYLKSSSDVGQLGMNSTGLQLRTRTAKDILFAPNNTERMRIQSGGGISFNGDTAAANALDDYEEGTWTPAVNGGTLTSDSWGKYIKIGHRVDMFYKVNISTMDNSTSSFTITGMPYIPTVTPSGGFTGSCMTNNINFQHTSNTAVVTYQSNGTGGIRLYSLGNNVVWRSLRRIEVNAADQIYGTHSFITN